jgi:hypothetical protein
LPALNEKVPQAPFLPSEQHHEDGEAESPVNLQTRVSVIDAQFGSSCALTDLVAGSLTA